MTNLAPVGAPTMAPLVQLGAAAGLAVMVVTSTGDSLVAGVVVGLVAADVGAGAAGVLVGIAVIGRWGSSSLGALAGGQAVLGAAGWSGPPAMVVSSWAAAAAMVLVCPRRREASSTASGVADAAVVACGLFAAAMVAGPAVGRDTASVVVLRVLASVVGVAATVVVARAFSPSVARVAGVVAAAIAATLAVLA